MKKRNPVSGERVLEPQAIDSFEKTHGQLEAMWLEFGQLSKKSPTDAVSKFKLNIVNGLIAEANTILGNEYLPVGGFASFNLDDVPTNSDVVLMLGQYLACFEKFRTDHVRSDEFAGWVWNSTRGEVPTSPPKKLKGE
jgi:hypothetical protein